jgi:hypothetical protein
MLVESSLIRVANSFRALRKGDFDGVAKSLGIKRLRKVPSKYSSNLRPEVISDLWLELQYGWKPLLSDIHGAVEQHHEIETEGSRLTAYVTGLAKDQSYRYRDLLASLTPSPGFGIDVRKHIDRHELAFVRLDYVRSDAVPADLLVQLGFTNPAQLAWELLPYSFVVDWALPLGEYFSLLDAAKGWSLKGGSLSRRVIEKSRVGFIKFRDGTGFNKPPWMVGNVSLNGKGRKMIFDRTIYHTSPAPPPPVLNTRSSLPHAANGLSLLASAFGQSGHRVRY